MKTSAWPPRYLSFLLRCWEEGNPQPGMPETWRFSLEDIHTGQRRGFASLEALLAYVRAELERDREEPAHEVTDKAAPGK